MKIIVIGLGALGTVFSCLLKEQGHQVIGIDRERVVQKIDRQGVRVTGIWGEHACRLDQVVSDAKQIDDRDVDLIILTVKSYVTGEAIAEIAGLVGSRSYLLLAQNGYGNYETAAKLVPEKKLILGRVIFGAETLALGVSKVTVMADDLILGSPKNLIELPVVERIAQSFTAAGIPARASQNVLPYLWGKIIYNSALNPLGAILEVPYGKLAETEETKALMNKIIDEIFQTLDAIGQKTLWKDADSYLGDFYGKLVPSTAGHHASMLQDIQHGRRTEIDALNGAVVSLGKKKGIATPVNEVITALVKAKEKLRSNGQVS